MTTNCFTVSYGALHSSTLCAFAVLLVTASVTVADDASSRTVVLAFGTNLNGQIGIGPPTGDVAVPTPIDTTDLFGESIIRIAGGRQHSLLVSDDGKAFAFGAGDRGITGIGPNSIGANIATPVNTTNLHNVAIVDAAANQFHSLWLSADGVVFSSGSNAVGRTGLGTVDPIGETHIPTPIDTTNLQGKNVTQVAAGRGHSLLLTDEGTVFSFGSNDRGVTGLGTIDGSTSVATQIDTTNLGGKKITQVAAGVDFSMIVAEDGTVYSFGWNDRSGRGTSIGYSLIPTQIDTSNLEGRKVIQVSAGQDHALLLADDGTVFSCGSSLNGKTGLGINTQTYALIATRIDTTNLGDSKIVKVAAGWNHSLLLSDNGTVFSMGSNFVGQTGLGTRSGNTTIATPINAPTLAGLRVIDIAAGADHSILIAVPEPCCGMLLLTFCACLVPIRHLYR